MAQPPQPSNGIPSTNPAGPHGQPFDPRMTMERMQAMQLNMFQQMHPPPQLTQMGQMPQNFTATFQIHGQPMGGPPNMPPNAQPNPVNILQHFANEAGRIGAMAPRPPPDQPPHVQATSQGTVPNAPTHLAPNTASITPPFQRPSSAPGHPQHRTTASEINPHPPRMSPFPAMTPNGFPPMFNHLPHPFTHTHHMPRGNGQPTVWLASSRNGPEALLFAPGHGFFTSQVPAPPIVPAPTPTTQPPGSTPQNAPQDAAAGVPPGQNQVAIRPPGNPDRIRRLRNPAEAENDFWALFLQRIWLFIRLYMFTVVLSESGTWRRYSLLAAAMLVCLLPRQNPLNQAFAAIRRHVDNLIGPPRRQPEDREVRRARRAHRREQRQRQGQVPAAGQVADGQTQPPPGDTAQALPSTASTPARSRTRGAVTTTPEETARRLVREHEQRNPNVLRDAFYWVEQSVALFLASLIPGVGEQHVAAREEARREEERERLEAQAAREEEEKKRIEEQEQKEKGKEGEESSDAGKVARGEGSDNSEPMAETASSSVLGVDGSATDAEAGSSSAVQFQTGDGDQGGGVRARFT